MVKPVVFAGFLVLVETSCGGSKPPYSLDVGTNDSGTFAGASSGGVAAGTLIVSVSPRAPAVCPGQCTALTPSATGGMGPYAYRWSPAGSVDGGADVVCPASTTTYTLTATDSSGHAGEFARPNAAGTATLTVTVSNDCVDGGAVAPDPGGGLGDAGAGLRFTQPTAAAWTGITVGVRQGGSVTWADWTAAGPGSVTGRLALPSGAIDVAYRGDVYGSQTTAGGNSWTPASAYTSATVPDPPPGPGIIELAGGPDTPDTLTFSQPVTNPLIAIVSLGTGYANLTATLVFDAPVTILSTGTPGFVGSGVLMATDGGVAGTEAQGVVEVEGTF